MIYTYHSPCIQVSGKTKEECIAMAKKWNEYGYDVWSGVYTEIINNKKMFFADLTKSKDMSKEELETLSHGDSSYENEKIFRVL